MKKAVRCVICLEPVDVHLAHKKESQLRFANHEAFFNCPIHFATLWPNSTDALTAHTPDALWRDLYESEFRHYE
jgi:hypothetical protein